MENSPFSMLELKDAYLIDSTMNSDTSAKLFPIEQNISGEDGTHGYRYGIFPCLNELLYKSPQVFSMKHVAKNLEHIYQKNQNYRTESRVHRSMYKRNKINIPQVSRTVGTYVYITWIYVWCGTLHMQDEREKYFRLVQVLKIVADL